MIGAIGTAQDRPPAADKKVAGAYSVPPESNLRDFTYFSKVPTAPDDSVGRSRRLQERLR